jgi:acyl carrier protein
MGNYFGGFLGKKLKSDNTNQTISKKQQSTEEPDMYILTKMIEIITNKFEIEESQILPETSFTNDLGADSLDFVALIREFEKEFNITIPDEDAKKISKLGDAFYYIKKNCYLSICDVIFARFYVLYFTLFKQLILDNS